MTQTIAVVASGAMGAGIGARLAKHGGHVLTTLDGRSAASIARAKSAHMHDAPPAELAEAPLFLSIVPPNHALALARQMAPLIRAAANKPIFVDLNAISPVSAAEVARVIEDAGASFVDGGIIGGPPGETGPGPTLYLSGPAQAAAAMLRDFGLVVKELDGGTGAASALKMSYAGITKGLTALAALMALAAERAGVGPALRDELAMSQAQLMAQFGKSVPDMFVKAYRWVPEMHEIEAFIGEDHKEGAMLRGAAELYGQIAADMQGDKRSVEALRRFFG